MTDEQIRQPVFHLQIAQQFNNLDLNGHVEGRGRLIQHQQAGPQHHGAGNRDTLALTARKLMRVAVHRCRIQPHFDHHLTDQITLVAIWVNLMDRQPFGDDLETGHARGKGAERVLKHDLHVFAQTAQFARRPLPHVLAHEINAALGTDQAHDRQRQRRLARPGFANDAQCLTCAHGQRRVIDRLHMPHSLAQQALGDRKPDFEVLG